jgi:hypothetical protein
VAASRTAHVASNGWADRGAAKISGGDVHFAALLFFATLISLFQYLLLRFIRMPKKVVEDVVELTGGF